MRFRCLIPVAAFAAVVGFAPLAEAQISSTETFNFRVGTTAPSTSFWSAGHGDIDIHEHTPGNWEIHYHFHSEPDPQNPSQPEDPPVGGGTPAFPGTPSEAPPTDPEFGWEWEAGDLTTFITSTTTAVTRPAPGGGKYAGPEWNFLGVTSGSTFYVLPASEVAGLPFIGFSAEGKSFDVTFSLGSVTGGAISAWTEDAFGAPTPYWSSSTPGANVGFTVLAGGHEHMFIGFSALGDYTAQITAVPEPGSLGLAGVAGLGLAAFAWIRRRRG